MSTLPAPTPALRARSLHRRVVLVAALLLAGVAVLLAVPGLRAATRDAASVRPAWLAGAVALEIASCVSFIGIFRQFFGELPAPAARQLGWIEMGSGALLPGGGAGALAAGGVLLHRAGMSTRGIVRRSSGLFFLTSATNVLALESGALLLALGVGHGPHGLLFALLPALAGIVGVAAVVAIPRSRWQRKSRSRALGSIVRGIADAERAVMRPSWRLCGAAGYLGFDIAVLGLACAGVGHPVGVPALVLAYVLGYAANALPVPGGIGVLEGGLVGALVIYGAPATSAIAAVLIYHTIAFWIPSLGGAIAYGMFVRRDTVRLNRAQVRGVDEPSPSRRGLARGDRAGTGQAAGAGQLAAHRREPAIDRSPLPELEPA